MFLNLDLVQVRVGGLIRLDTIMFVFSSELGNGWARKSLTVYIQGYSNMWIDMSSLSGIEICGYSVL